MAPDLTTRLVSPLQLIATCFDALRRIFSAGVASINVGPEEVPFDAHIELLCDCSPYFNDIFEARYTKPLTEPVLLPDVDPEGFADFLCWAYQGNLETAFKEVPTWTRLSRLWLLGGKLKTPRLQNTVVTWWFAKFRKDDLDEASIYFIYDKTFGPSPLRSLAAGCYAERIKKDRFDSSKSKLPSRFFEDLCSRLLENDKVCAERTNLPHCKVPLIESHYLVDEPASRPFPPPRFESDDRCDTPKLASDEQLQQRRIVTPKGKRSASRGAQPESTSSHSSASSETNETQNLVTSKLEGLKI